MSKSKKKRSKAYKGVDSSQKAPTVIRIKAENRSPIKQWWVEKKSIARPVAITTAIILLIIWFIYELFRTIG